MYYERKLRDKRKIIWLLGLGLLFMMITLMHTDKIMAANIIWICGKWSAKECNRILCQRDRMERILR